MAKYRLTINGVVSTVEADQHSPLLYVLRHMGLIGTRYGCGLEQCGSCRVIVNDKLEYACTIKVGDLSDANIRTVEGLTKKMASYILFNAPSWRKMPGNVVTV
ncbi:MAG: 2Fe-2S iron-sulfur cluster-binding protein [Pseudomonadales bacterium]|jgi:aerobic-type carbon monoxide dehydrogenase small subunit (CoxS/CutS family)